jgi:hypothetical protein
MSKQFRIHSFFKVKTSDEIEVEELLLNQISRASRTTTNDTVRSTISTISTKIISIIDLSSEKNNIESLVNYESDSVNDNVIEETIHQSNDVDSDSGVEYIGDISVWHAGQKCVVKIP